MGDDNDDLLDVSEAAKVAWTGESTIRRWCATGLLPGARPAKGGRGRPGWLIPRSVLLELLKVPPRRGRPLSTAPTWQTTPPTTGTWAWWSDGTTVYPRRAEATVTGGWWWSECLVPPTVGELPEKR